MELNINEATGKCGIVMMASYLVKKGQNPPNSGPSPPVNPPVVCSKHFSCAASTTCCCARQFGRFCFQCGCCPTKAAICCKDHSSCCPSDYPVCNLNAGTCSVVSLIVSRHYGQYGRFCFQCGCCPTKAAICCEDHSSCCPSDYPVCNLNAGTCSVS